MRSLRSLAGSLALITLPAVASAQWQFTPFGGAYLPTGPMAKMTAAGGGSSVAMEYEHQPAMMVGATASRWFAPKLGVSVSGGYVASDAKVTASGTGFFGSGTESAYLVLTNAELLIQLPRTRNMRTYFGLGPSLMWAGGKAYDETNGEKLDLGTNIGGVVEIATDVPLTGFMDLKLGAASYMYQVQLKYRNANDPASNFNFDTKFVTDFVLSAGLAFTFPTR